MNLFPTAVSVSDLQRNYAKVIKKAKSSDQPVILLRNNKPELALVNLKKLQYLIDRTSDWETKDALEAIKEGELAYKTGKTTVLSDNLHELLED